jgi:hypothetical protein
VTGAVTSVTSFALSVGEELDALNDVANRTGVGVEALQAYARAAADTGVSVESFAKQIQKLTINIGKATLDEKAQKKFEELGIVVKGLAGSILGELAGPISTIAQELLGVIKQAGPQQIAQQVASGLLDFIKLAGNAFLGLAKFIEAFVKKFAPILGLDIRSETEKELDRLRSEQQAAIVGGTGATVDGFGRPLANAAAIEEENRKRTERIAQLEAQVAAEAAAGVLSQFQANFNAAIDTAREKLDEKMQSGTLTEEDRKLQEAQLRELQQFNRMGQIGTVEILN